MMWIILKSLNLLNILHIHIHLLRIREDGSWMSPVSAKSWKRCKQKKTYSTLAVKLCICDQTTVWPERKAQHKHHGSFQNKSQIQKNGDNDDNDDKYDKYDSDGDGDDDDDDDDELEVVIAITITMTMAMYTGSIVSSFLHPFAGALGANKNESNR